MRGEGSERERVGRTDGRREGDGAWFLKALNALSVLMLPFAEAPVWFLNAVTTSHKNCWFLNAVTTSDTATE